MATTIKAKLTKRTVDAAAPPAEGEVWVWDTEIKGFILRVRKSGRKVYAVRYRLGSRQATYTIGTHGSPWTPDDARSEAMDILRRVRDGEDPTTAKRAAREALTVAQLIEAYVTDGPATKPNKRASTWMNDASNLRRHVAPLLGRKLADSVSNADAARAYRDIVSGKTAVDVKTGLRGRAIVTGGEGVARRTRTTAAAMYAWGIAHGVVKTNPFATVKLTAAPTRERFLSRQEAATFLDKLTELEKAGEVGGGFADAMRLLLLTGARKTEILALRWSEVDTDRRAILLPPERTKAGGTSGERRVLLSPAALTILARRAADRDAKAEADKGKVPSPYVFPASRGEGPIIGLRRPFKMVMAAAKLDGVRIHDLRHSFASFAVADKQSLFMVGKLLGHASTRTTERYAHLADDPLQDAVAAIGDRLIPTATEGGGEVVPLPRRA
ncbi:MAG: site-specific integrase [Brevundimonas sp.]|uniref:tyrosine-type recombinase/integrase n=1 Tax=Brevundimonas sp. TaxID=1871086 RepID=UPI0027349BA9|nr:site-specific integrase [Brevundimonas sp.]MDP3406601.1 site-specific integrase [Brevundimonas sp.]